MQLLVNANIVERVTSSYALFMNDKTFFMKKTDVDGADSVACWLTLGKQAQIADVTYETIELIYARPQFRQTRAVGIFLLALKKNLQCPLILGSGKYGGVLFNDGLKLVHSLDKSTHFSVSVLDTETGEKTELRQGTIPSGKNKTLVFENRVNDFPLIYRTSVADLFIFEDDFK